MGMLQRNAAFNNILVKTSCFQGWKIVARPSKKGKEKGTVV